MPNERSIDTPNGLGNTRIAIQGRVEIEVRRNGKRIYDASKKNLIVQTGEVLAVSRFNYTAADAAPRWLAFGTSAIIAEKSQTALLAEIVGSRFAAVSGLTFGTVLRLGYNIVVPGIWNDVAEVGLFNANAGGAMISRSVIPPFSAVAADAIGAIWYIEFLGME